MRPRLDNLVNIVSANFFSIGFNRYAAVMAPVNVVSVLATLGVLYLYFRSSIPARYNASQLAAPHTAIPRSRHVPRWMAGARSAADWILWSRTIGVPVSAVAAVGALILFVVAARGHLIDTRKVLRGAPWQIVIFSLGMYLVVYGLRNAGLTDALAGALTYLAGQGLWVATIGTGVISAVLSSIMNNMPTVLVSALAIDASQATGVIKEAMVYANVIGSDLGPKITPIGSLATLLWLHVLARKQIRISWGYYFKVGIVLTLPVLLVTLAALAFRLSF